MVDINGVDQIYHISSKQSSFNFIFYSLSSVLSMSYHFLGLIIIPITCLFYICYKRNLKADTFLRNIAVLLSLGILVFVIVKIFFPSLIGHGLYLLYKTKMTWYLKILTLFSSIFIMIFFLTGWSVKTFKESFSHSKVKLLDLKNKVNSYLDVLSPRAQLESCNESPDIESYAQLVNSSDLDFLDDDYEYEIAEDVSLEKVEIEAENELEETQELKELMKSAPKLNRKRKVKRDGYKSEDALIGNLISKDRKIIIGPDQAYFESIISKLEEKLTQFKIDSKIINVIKGPVVDTFEVELGPGVKVSKVTNLTEDLSLALSGAPIRMVYPLQGRTTMGIEVPRSPREIIYLDDVLKTAAFKSAEKRLPVAMGKNAFGETTVVDLAAMPHMLVAGSTGAGKSVFVNTLLVSLLIKLSPEKLKLILIDPKQLELALYARLPHLLMPVMTDPKSSSIALLWACQEMERRYTILKEMGVRNVEGFNKKLKTSSKQDLLRIKDLYKEGESFELPYIVVIVDEFADLILSKCGKDIEVNICRLAAKARASGIHLVLATQRPSVDVITGLIKSNFPTRVSFRVTSPVDSRTILNSMGAEKLLGKGDMLYKQGVETQRLHSSYVDEAEIEKLVESMGDGDPKFSKSALEFIDEIENGATLDDIDGVSIQQTFKLEGKDEYYKEAVDIIQEVKACSASMLQRRLRIGYNRAANLVDQLEADGIVGPAQGSKPRKVLI